MLNPSYLPFGYLPVGQIKLSLNGPPGREISKIRPPRGSERLRSSLRSLHREVLTAACITRPAGRVVFGAALALFRDP